MTHVWSDELKREFEKFLELHYPDSPDIWLLPDDIFPANTIFPDNMADVLSSMLTPFSRDFPINDLKGKDYFITLTFRLWIFT